MLVVSLSWIEVEALASVIKVNLEFTFFEMGRGIQLYSLRILECKMYSKYDTKMYRF